MKTTAIILAAGQGKRMGTDVAKQFLLLDGKPVLYYSLKNFEDSPINEIVLVTGEGMQEYCKKELVERFGFRKIRKIVSGGKERYHSVAYGLREVSSDCDFVLIHDGARPFVTRDIIKRGLSAVQEHHACVVGMPVKDTIKICDENGFAAETPNRKLVWQIQTPQIFDFRLIAGAYEKLLLKEDEVKKKGIVVTDDAMVVELFTDYRVKFVKGSYQNIKLTTPEDLLVVDLFMKNEQLDKNE